MFNYNELLEKTTDFDKKLIEQDLEIFKKHLWIILKITKR